MDLLQALNWRYATKKMDPTKSVPEAKVQRILEAIRLTATSSGLQPYEVFVVTNPEVRAKIQAAANNQAQITEGSHLLVFAAWNDYTAERINMMFDYNNEVRGFVNEGAENYRKMLLANYPAKGLWLDSWPATSCDSSQHLRSQSRALHCCSQTSC